MSKNLKEVQDSSSLILRINRVSDLKGLCGVLNSFNSTNTDKEVLEKILPLLPSFGGERPSKGEAKGFDLKEVYSWDKDSFLTKSVYGVYIVVPRGED